MNVQEIMTPSIDLVDPGMTMCEAAIRMRDGDVGALPVGENDRLLGMVTDRDITVRGVASDKAPGDCTVREVMSGGIYYCFEHDDAKHASELMAEHKVRRLPVLNSEKRLVGIVALSDLAIADVENPAIEGVSTATSDERI